MSDSFTTQLIEGIAQLLAADPDGGLSWQSSGVYADGETGIYVLAVPQSPDRIVSLSPAPMKASPTLSDSMFNLQTMSRSTGQDPRDVFALDDAVQNVLLGNYPLTLATGVRIGSLQYIGGASGGQDDNNRWLWASRYQLSVHRPGPHRH